MRRSLRTSRLRCRTRALASGAHHSHPQLHSVVRVETVMRGCQKNHSEALFERHSTGVGPGLGGPSLSMPSASVVCVNSIPGPGRRPGASGFSICNATGLFNIAPRQATVCLPTRADTTLGGDRMQSLTAANFPFRVCWMKRTLIGAYLVGTARQWCSNFHTVHVSEAHTHTHTHTHTHPECE